MSSIILFLFSMIPSMELMSSLSLIADISGIFSIISLRITPAFIATSKRLTVVLPRSLLNTDIFFSGDFIHVSNLISWSIHNSLSIPLLSVTSLMMSIIFSRGLDSEEVRVALAGSSAPVTMSVSEANSL